MQSMHATSAKAQPQMLRAAYADDGCALQLLEVVQAMVSEHDQTARSQRLAHRQFCEGFHRAHRARMLWQKHWQSGIRYHCQDMVAMTSPSTMTTEHQPPSHLHYLHILHSACLSCCAIRQCFVDCSIMLQQAAMTRSHTRPGVKVNQQYGWWGHKRRAAPGRRCATCAAWPPHAAPPA